jgi:hypothetical protein
MPYGHRLVKAWGAMKARSPCGGRTKHKKSKKLCPPNPVSTFVRVPALSASLRELPLLPVHSSHTKATPPFMSRTKAVPTIDTTGRQCPCPWTTPEVFQPIARGREAIPRESVGWFNHPGGVAAGGRLRRRLRSAHLQPNPGGLRITADGSQRGPFTGPRNSSIVLSSSNLVVRRPMGVAPFCASTSPPRNCSNPGGLITECC